MASQKLGVRNAENCVAQDSMHVSLHCVTRKEARMTFCTMPRSIEGIGKIGNKRPALLLIALTALILVDTLAWPHEGLHTFTGEIQDSTCASTAAHVERECALGCVRQGAKWVLYDPSKKEIHQLDDQKAAGKFAAQQVSVLGTLDKSTKTIHVVKIAPGKE
jgi:hypothetical protein